MIDHARYIRWSAATVKVANVMWAAQHRDDRPLMTRDSLDARLFRWAIREGFIEPMGALRMAHSGYLAPVLAEYPEAIEEEAERYARELADERRSRLF